MNTQPIESGFAQMGARVKVREIPSRWTQGDRSWISPQDYALDIQRDGKGEFFELRVPTHLSETLDVTVMQSEPKQRHLLLFVRKPGDKPQLDRFLCGHDEREWFVAAVPGGASSVRQAMDALQPEAVRQALASHQGLVTNKRYSRKNRAFRRQGEWFFVPEPSLVVDRQARPAQRTASPWGGKPHLVEQLFRTGGETVYVCSKHPNGLTARRNTSACCKSNPSAARWGWRMMRRNPGVYARGTVRHCRPRHHHAAVLASGHDEHRDPEPHDAQRGIPGLITNNSRGVRQGRLSSHFPSCSSKAEHPADNRKTQERYRAGRPFQPRVAEAD